MALTLSQDLNTWDAACMALDDKYKFISNSWQWATLIDDDRQVRAGLVAIWYEWWWW